MTHRQTILELQRLIGQLDAEQVKLRRLIEQGEKLRAGMVKQMAALAAEEQGKPLVIYIGGIDRSDD